MTPDDGPTRYGPCPNCAGGEVIRVENSPMAGKYGSVIVLTMFQIVPIARLVCLGCGYVREWVDNRRHLDLLREKYGDQLRPR